MSNAADSEQPPEIAEQTETIPIADLEPSPDLPPPPPSSPPPAEDEQSPISEPTRMNGTRFYAFMFCLCYHKVLLHLILLFSNCCYLGILRFRENIGIWKKIFKDKRNQLSKFRHRLRNQNDYLIEDLRELKEKQGVKHGPSLNHWVRFEDHCYHQTMEMVPWLSCFDLCVSLNATFLKTGGSRLKNIMELVTGNRTWLGLSYKEEDNDWKWEDGSSPSSELDLPKPSLDFQGKCVYLNSHTVGTDNCTRSSSCLCEKTVHQKSEEES
uniref:Killer cell lectin-like receptor 5 n=1 Tax=Ailuropoda melanoleuca TaxID=9646 RepID=A0A7N5KIJ8_AILME